MISSVKKVFVDLDMRLLQSILTILVLLTAILCYYDASHFNGIPGMETSSTKFINRLHLATATVSTVGYGDISPKSSEVRLICILAQILMMLELHTSVRNVYELKYVERQEKKAAAERRSR